MPTKSTPKRPAKTNRPRRRPGSKPKPKTRASAGAKTPANGGSETQIGSLMSKSLDLAEASLTLGMNFVQRLGSTVQDQVIGRLAQVGQSFAQGAAAAPPPEPPRTANTNANAGANADAQPQPKSPGFKPFAGVVNQQPLFAGSPIRVSFSINNDSQSAVKKVALKLEGLLGEVHGGTLTAALAVEPPAAAIAPMDFEKFVIRGLVPMGTRSDAYQGWIVVSGDEELRIPLRLAITGRR